MSALPSSPAAFTAQSVASAAVASPQQPLQMQQPQPSQQSQQQPLPVAVVPSQALPQQLPQASQPLAAAQPPLMSGPGGPAQPLQSLPYGAVPPVGGPRGGSGKPRSRPPSGGMGGGYDSKQYGAASAHKFANGAGAPGPYKPQPQQQGLPQGMPQGIKPAGYPQQHQLPHHAAAAQGSYVSHGATAAVGIGGAMQPLMFAAYQQQPHGQYSQSQSSAPAAAAAGSAAQQQQMMPGGGYAAPFMGYGGQPAMGAGAGMAAPGQPAMPGSAVAPGAEGTLRKVIKVSSKSNVKSVAGAISHTTRAGESPTLMATGSESVNQAVKAIAIARGYLAENKLDVSCQPVFRNQEKGAITFVLSKGVLRGKKPGEDDDIQQLRVARGSDPNSVAGSIANKVRNGERVLVQSIGAGSVDITVRAITLARRFLEGDAIDVCFRPEFIHVKLDEGERSAVKFTILAQQV